jgi:TolA-binding protein
MVGQSSLDDYELASRTAYAHVSVPGAGGQAHLYKGVALFRRGDYTRAEQEFASALNFDPGSATPDARAWWHMAAVATGACGESAQRLADGLAHVSDFFPRQEAEAMLRRCPTSRRISENFQLQPAAR